MADTIDGADDPLAAVLAATEAARPAQVAAAGSEAQAIAKVDAMIALMQAAIRNHPRFVALEAAWRSLHRLVDAQDDGPVVVKLLPLTKREAIRDQRAVQDPEDSDLVALLWHEGMGAGEPFGLLLADMEFAAEAEEVQALRGLAAAGAGGFVPVVAHASPGLLDIEDWPTLPGRRGDLARLHEGPRHIAWRGLRESDEARFLALVAPPVLACGGPGAPRWTGGGWVLAARIAAAFRRDGWSAGIEGREDGAEPGLPPMGRMPTACDAGEQEAALAALGLVTLVPTAAERATIFAAPSLHRPRRYHEASATADARLAAGLPWVLATGRILHALALRARREVQRGRGNAAAVQALNAWLATLVAEDGPLAAGSAELPEPGVVAARLRVRLAQGTPAAAHRLALALP